MSLQQVSGSKTLSGVVAGSDPFLRLNANNSCLIGAQAAAQNAGSCNVIVGTSANRDGSSTNRCVLVGYMAGDRLSSDGHVCIGDTAAFGLASQGCNSVVIGSLAAYASTVVDRCVYIGVMAGSGLQGSLNTCVGPNTGDVWSGADSAEASCVTSMGAYTTVTGAGALSVGYSNSHTGIGGLTLGAVCANAGLSSIVIGSGITNTGAGCVLVGPSTAIGSGSQGFCNTTDHTVNIGGVLMASGSSTTTLAGGVISIASTGGVQVAGQLRCTNGGAFVSGLSTDTLSIGMAPTKTWTVAVAASSSSSSLVATDLVFTSGEGRPRFTITDDFVPGVLNFTGQHRCVFFGNVDGDALIGRIVVTTGAYCDLNGRDDNVLIDEAVPVVRLSTGPCDKRVFGVVSGDDTLFTETHTESGTQGTGLTREFRVGLMRFCVPIDEGTPRRRMVINALGEGGIWVCDCNGPLQNGDYITTSTVAGMGMRQDGAQAYSWTVGKITCDCDFQGTTTVDERLAAEYHDGPLPYRCRVHVDPVTGVRSAFVGCTYGR